MNDISTPVFYILLSLAVKDRHGYDIMKQVAADSLGRIQMGPGTLYGAIKRMLGDTLIVSIKGNDPRRKYYSLTEKGKTTLAKELERYNDALTLAKKNKLVFHLLGAAYAI